MKAMILAAGLGKRMRPLTDNIPKPLLQAGDKPLIQHTVERLCRAGIRDLVINIAYLGNSIRDNLGDGEALGVSIDYSEEQQPLETGGAVNRALPLLGKEPFIMVNSDVWSDYPFALLAERELSGDRLGHLVLVPNPDHNRIGDYALDDTDCVVLPGEGERLTFSGISLLSPALIEAYPQRREVFPLREALDYAIAQRRLSGEIYRGDWRDIGTPERLWELDAELTK